MILRQAPLEVSNGDTGVLNQQVSEHADHGTNTKISRCLDDVIYVLHIANYRTIGNQAQITPFAGWLPESW